MKRFIRYLYEYEQEKRMRNVGFVKVEQGEDECIVHIHGKGLRMGSETSLHALVSGRERQIILILLSMSASAIRWRKPERRKITER